MEEQLSLFLEDKNSDKELKEAKKEITELRKKINYYSDLYYNQDKPEISDYDYDKLMLRLKELEKNFPTLITKSSPTMKVQGNRNSNFAKVTHEIQMQSLNDVFSYEEVEDFVNKIYEEYGQIDFSVETKIDGLSMSLEYVDGTLKMASTRGDGKIGEDVTRNALMIDDVVENLSEKETIEVRGEVYLLRDNFNKINEELESKNKQMLLNPRNAAAGTLRQLDPELVKNRHLNIFVFNVQKSDKKFTSHLESLDYLKKIGITTVPYAKRASSKEEVIERIKEIGEIREDLPFDIDGAVVKVDDLSIREKLGKTQKVPRWAVAYKYPPIAKETKIEEVKVQVGRTGKITPLAIVSKVFVAGSNISKCTLHNFDYINQKDIRLNDSVLISKAGDVIPEVQEVLVNKRNGNEIKIIAPTVCPVCGEPLYKEEGEVDLRCLNSECDAQIYRAIVHFASRDAMNILSLGESVVDKLLEQELIKDVADIYYLKYEDLLKLENFGELSSKNLLEAINKSKENKLSKLIFGLGIRHVGKKAAETLSQMVNTIYDLYDIDKETLIATKDIGTKIADSIYEFFRKEKTRAIISKLDKAHVNLNGEKKQTISKKLDDMTICITGSFENITRDEIENIIKINSGNVTSSVSKNTSLLIVGEAAGSKLDKALKLDIETITLDEFREKFNI